MEIIDINNFFDFNNKEPINRIAYTEEDAKYKLKCMKEKMKNIDNFRSFIIKLKEALIQ